MEFNKYQKLILVITMIVVAAYLFYKNANFSFKNKNAATDTTAVNSFADTSNEVYEKADTTPGYYEITNLKTYTNEKFEESVSFYFINRSDETISNIMFEEAYFPIKQKKGDFTNKKINLSPKDSIRFVFNTNHDELFVYKIRFASGNSVTLGDPDNDALNYANMIYSKPDDGGN